MKLRTRIFLTFSVLATIPLVIFTVFCYKRYTETTYDRIDVISSHLFENAQKTANDTLNGGCYERKRRNQRRNFKSGLG